MRHRALRGLALPLLCLLAACQQYDVTVNDRVVYTPRPLFTDFAASDPALQQCLQAAVDAGKITAASQLRELSCREAGIRSLAGLSTFSGLRELDLTGNAIADISELGALIALEEAYLADNQIVDPLPLASLQALHTVDLSGNASLRCPDRQALLRVAALQLPSHCPRAR
jgi:Leucine-rich repeat (LRR) protein